MPIKGVSVSKDRVHENPETAMNKGSIRDIGENDMSEYPKSAVFYGRVSGRSQTEEHKDGFRRQRESVHRFAKAHGILIVGEYLEKAVSGTKDLDDRPAFQEMLSDLLGNGCIMILVEALDRLAREYRIQEQILIYLSTKGIDLIAVNTGEIVTQAIQDDPMKKALVQIQGIFHELDKGMLVRKLQKSREAKKQRGERCEGTKPFGFHEGEEECLRRMKALYRKPKGRPRRGYAEIARMLNSEGFSNRAGRPFTRNSVYALLRRRCQDRKSR